MYDTLIIGAGPAGMTAALYAARSNLKVALLEAGIPGGQMNNTSDIENYPGYANISGPELAERCSNSRALGVEHLFGRAENIVDQGTTRRLRQMMVSFKPRPLLLRLVLTIACWEFQVKKN